VARIYRQMGRPYDASLIPERERHYLNGGWDDGDKDGYRAENPVRKMPDFGARSGVRTPDTLLPSFGPQQGGAKGPYWSIDPLAKGRRPGWGTGGGPADNVRTMEYQPGRDNYGTNIQLASGTLNDRQYGLDGVPKRADSSGRGNWGKGTDVAKYAIKLNKFGEKAYNVAREKGYSNEDAMEIAREAQFAQGVIMIGDAYLGKKLKGGKYFFKEVGRELTEDELNMSIIEKTINNRERAKNPPEGTILPP
jgi:hypothetical protein